MVAAHFSSDAALSWLLSKGQGLQNGLLLGD